jgi:hypothetical protein
MAADPPELVNYQGVLRDAAGAPLDGSFDMVFRLYDSDGGSTCTGGTLLLADSHLAAGTGAVQVTDGLFNVRLGSGGMSGPFPSLSPVFADHSTVYMEAEVGPVGGPGEVLCPRMRVVAAAYSLNADRLDGTDSSAFMRSDASDAFTGTNLIVDGGATLDVDGTLRMDGTVTKTTTDLVVNLNADLLDGQNAGSFASAVHGHTGGEITGTVGDANTLDTVDSSQFLRSDTSDEFSGGTLTIGAGATLDGVGTVQASSYGDRDDGSYLLDPSSISTLNGLALRGTSLHYNWDGPDSTVNLYFYDDGSSTGEQIMFDPSNERFFFSAQVESSSDARFDRFTDWDSSAYWVDPAGASSARLYGDLSLGYGSATDADTLYFDQDGQSLEWRDSTQSFVFSTRLVVDGSLNAPVFYDSDDPDYSLNPSSINSGFLRGNLSIGYGSSSDDDYLYFDRGGESLSWNNTYDRFFFSDDIHVDGGAHAIEGSGVLAGGFFTDSGDSGEAYIGYGDYGVYAVGDYDAGYFSADAVGGFGVEAYGQSMGGYFRDLTTSSLARVGHDIYKIHGTGTPSFVQNHPLDADRVIVYSAPEGDEVATYTRGTARLVGGEAHVLLGKTFQWVTNPDIGLTAHLTPREEAVPLAVVSLSTEELVVRGPVDTEFDYIVFGLRIGFEEASIVQEKQEESRVPSMAAHRERYAKHPDLRSYNALERFKVMRVERGATTDPDFSASTALLAAISEYDPALDGPVPRHRPGSPVHESAATFDDVSDASESTTRAGAAVGGDVVHGEITSTSGTVLTEEGSDVYARSFRPSAADLASLVQVDEPVEAGDVLVIDTEHAGVARLATIPSDPAVLGVVAAEPGVLLGTSRPGDSLRRGEPGAEEEPLVVDGSTATRVPVAFSGIALCKVDAGYGAIRPGDLVTTSPTWGHAMRAGDPQPGTILGKALESQETGTGLIKVLVMLR